MRWCNRFLLVLTMTTQYRQAFVQSSISAAADWNAERAPDGVDVICGGIGKVDARNRDYGCAAPTADLK